jgi:hypothetical protein
MRGVGSGNGERGCEERSIESVGAAWGLFSSGLGFIPGLCGFFGMLMTFMGIEAHNTQKNPHRALPKATSLIAEPSSHDTRHGAGGRVLPVFRFKVTKKLQKLLPPGKIVPRGTIFPS